MTVKDETQSLLQRQRRRGSGRNLSGCSTESSSSSFDEDTVSLIQEQHGQLRRKNTSPSSVPSSLLSDRKTNGKSKTTSVCTKIFRIYEPMIVLIISALFATQSLLTIYIGKGKRSSLHYLNKHSDDTSSSDIISNLRSTKHDVRQSKYKTTPATNSYGRPLIDRNDYTSDSNWISRRNDPTKSTTTKSANSIPVRVDSMDTTTTNASDITPDANNERKLQVVFYMPSGMFVTANEVTGYSLQKHKFGSSFGGIRFETLTDSSFSRKIQNTGYISNNHQLLIDSGYEKYRAKLEEAMEERTLRAAAKYDPYEDQDFGYTSSFSTEDWTVFS